MIQAMSVFSAPQPLGRRVLRDSAYDLLLDMLLDGTLPPDAALSIDGLARQLGISPTPVREALVHLEHTGLVTRTALRGYRVAPPITADHIGQLADARGIVELGALQLALERRDSLLPVLREAHERHSAVIADIDAHQDLSDRDRVAAYRRYFEADWEFHQAFLQHADNAFLVQLSATLGSHVHRLRQTIGVGLTDSHEARTEHGRILAALERGAPDQSVVAALDEHLQAHAGPLGRRRSASTGTMTLYPSAARSYRISSPTLSNEGSTVTDAVAPEVLLAGRPPEPEIELDPELIRAGRRLVFLDDDPTGTQTSVDLPVLTSWSVADLGWALEQPTAGFFVLTNTRSLSAADAADRNREVIAALHEAATAAGIPYAIASRSDSTLRGYFPLETDVIAEELAARGAPVDGVLIIPAYIEPGRVTVDSVHWTRTPDGMIPVAQSEFAADASFGYASSDLRDWVAEKTGGRISRDDVARITLDDIRTGGPDRVRAILAELRDGRPAVVDAASDADLRVVVAALLQAESDGQNFVYRIGPSFVRARVGQRAAPAIDADRLRELLAGQASDAGDDRPETRHGLVVIGSHVGLTTRQLDGLRDQGDVIEVELEVPLLLDDQTRDQHLAEVADRAADSLRRNEANADVVLRTSRTLVKGDDAAHSLDIARSVSSALVQTVHGIVSQIRPAFVVAKGGITSSDTATDGLEIRRAWVRGTMLPGIISLVGTGRRSRPRHPVHRVPRQRRG